MHDILASLCRGVRCHPGRCEQLFGALVFLLLLPAPSLGYALDSHYQLRFGRSAPNCQRRLEPGCQWRDPRRNASVSEEKQGQLARIWTLR